MNKFTFIYGLKEIGGEIRYVGKTNNPKKRFNDHMKNYKKSKSHKNSWIKYCKNNGIKIEMVILEKVDCSKWQQREIFFISHFKNLTNHKKGGEGGSTNINTLNYTDACEWVKKCNLNIVSSAMWHKLHKEKKIPDFLPGDPRITYKNFGWKSWNIFLGTNYICNIIKHKNYIKFEDAVSFVRQLSIKSSRKWNIWHEINKPKNIPKYPHSAYKEWKGWEYFLGTDPKRSNNYMSYEESKKFIKKFNFNNRKQFYNWIRKIESLETKVPRSPDRVYENCGWTNWKDFLGY